MKTRDPRSLLAIVAMLVLGACAPGDERAEEPPDQPVREDPGDPADPEEPREEVPADPDEPRVLFVDPDGSDEDPGTQESPFGSLDHAIRQLEAGDTLRVRGGTYTERLLDIEMPEANSDAPTQVIADGDEEPVVRGLLWVEGGANWILDGINVTWDPTTGRSDEHMVKVTNGRDWIVRNAELSDAESFAALLVTGTTSGEPAGWEVSNNCIRHTVPTNETNQDHNLYINTGLNSGPGMVEGNVLLGAPNGQNIKLGPPGEEGGTADTTVRYNTMYDAGQNLLISGESRDNLVERNIMGGTLGGYGTIRGFHLTGEGNVARDNIGFESRTMIYDPDDREQVIDGGGNEFPVDPGFRGAGHCTDLTPTNTDVEGYGHTALADASD